ncbi:FAD-dependent oxidoreductase [Philodulcilactobacillus myokoensis]|uniref:FAD-dependent oxidoreductase n=1 Tax=Philodulcilactobacillus myokoensis TaxID=2929573 RepID=A0A9W6B151_9LACO|nr:FAD/NAD(P)-binding protein [Philodulcilactobacillus myokoensis]GLB46560.1 FAD-dependent oxidoreductase [Philodulcilactobacillus myokoensis]
MKVAIIGAGPRGILVTRYLIEHFKQSQIDQLAIHLFDPYPIGGRTWRTDQSIHLIMNTDAQDISMFNNCRQGPSLDQWARTEAPDFILGDKHPFQTELNSHSKINTYQFKDQLFKASTRLMPTNYTPRPLYGVYLQWCFQRMTSERYLPKNVSIHIHQKKVLDVERKGNQFNLMTDHKEAFDDNFDHVVLNVGLSENHPNQQQQALQKYANNNHLNYILPGYPSDTPLSHIKPRSNVIIRGLGLSFFDYVTLLTEGRGGRFQIMPDNTLSYNKSGQEPHIYAGSRRGMPYYPKGTDQKRHNEAYQPHFLTHDRIQRHLDNYHLPYQDFVELLKLDMEYVYYTRLVQAKYPNVNLDQFKSAFIEDPKNAIKHSKINHDDLLDWDHVLNPVAGVKITTVENYQKTIINKLQKLINGAAKGTKTDPLSSALSTIIDFEDTIRTIVRKKLFTNDDYEKHFLKDFNSTSRFISMGPPLIRIKQLKALIKSDIVTIIPPQMHVAGAKQQFKAVSYFYPKEIFSGDTLIEARLPKIDLEHSDNVVLNHLKAKGIDSSYQKDDHFNNHFYKWGNINEGKSDWLTTISPKNKDYDFNKVIATKIADTILNIKSNQN